MALQANSMYQISKGDQILWERGDLSIDGIYRAWRERRDRRVAEYIIKLAQLDPQPKGYKKWAKEGKPHYDQLVDAVSPWRLNRNLSERARSLTPLQNLMNMKRSKIRDLIAEIHAEHWKHIQAFLSTLYLTDLNFSYSSLEEVIYIVLLELEGVI